MSDKLLELLGSYNTYIYLIEKFFGTLRYLNFLHEKFHFGS